MGRWRMQRYIDSGFEQIGSPPRRRADEEASFPEVDAEGGRRPGLAEAQDVHQNTGAMEMAFDTLPRTAAARVLTVSDCDNLCQWTNGTCKLFNPRLLAPLRRILNSIDDLRQLGAKSGNIDA